LLIPIDREDLHNTTLAARQPIAVAIHLGSDSGLINAETRGLEGFGRAPAERKPPLGYGRRSNLFLNGFDGWTSWS
jgi:hypothetical protein